MRRGGWSGLKGRETRLGADRRLVERGGACGKGWAGNGIGGPIGFVGGARCPRGRSPEEGQVEAAPCPQGPQD